MSNVKVMLDKKLTDDEEEVLERFIEFQEAMINKDEDKLYEIIDTSYTLTHMSGKVQTRQEYIEEIMDGTLNYYESIIMEPAIFICDDTHAKLSARVRLDAKVYGIKGVWTLDTDVSLENIEGVWVLSKWDN